MVGFLGPLLAAVVAFVVVLTELLTSKYPRTIFLVSRCSHLYWYGLIYAVIAAGICWLIPNLPVAGVNTSNMWIRALVVGVAVKAFLHIRLFSVSVGPGKTVPVGIETVVQLFEPWLLTEIDLCQFNNEGAFLGPREAKYPVIADTRSTALNGIPGVFADDLKAAMRTDLANALTVRAILSAFLKYVGRRTFEQTFPV